MISYPRKVALLSAFHHATGADLAELHASQYRNTLNSASRIMLLGGLVAGEPAPDYHMVTDAIIDTSINIATARGMRTVAWHPETAETGYKFFIDSGGEFVYKKTTNFGETWSAPVTIAIAATHIAFDIWADWWTPGDTGLKIHTWYFDSTSHNVIWRTLNITDDSFAAAVTVFDGASAIGVRGAFVSGTKTRSGYLYCAYDIDSGSERGLKRSTDSGATWSANLSTTFVEAVGDQAILFPASNTGDNNDCWALYLDVSVSEFTLKMWDSSAVSATESVSIWTVDGIGTDGIGQFPVSGSVRHSDGHLIVAAVTAIDTALADHRITDINGTGSITELTAIAIDKDDHYHPAVFIDQTTDDIYVAYNGKADGSENYGVATKVYYKKSTDGGTTWSAETGVMETAAGEVRQVWTPMMGPVFWFDWMTWTVGDTVFTLTGNHVVRI